MLKFDVSVRTVQYVQSSIFTPEMTDDCQTNHHVCVFTHNHPSVRREAPKQDLRGMKNNYKFKLRKSISLAASYNK